MREGQLASVVINNYNYGRYLGEAIESALAQTYVPLEVVVVDDGSTDESRAVIASFGERIVPVLKENGGQGSALNAGFAACRGEVVLFLDADDMLLPTAAERAVEALQEPGVTKVHWPLWEIDAHGGRTGGLQPPGELPDGDVRDLVIREGPTAWITPPTSANAWTRHFLERVLPMPEREFYINSDGYLVTLGWIYGRVRTIPEPQGFYRIHGDNHFVSKPPDEKNRRHYEMYMHRCDALAQHLSAMGVDADSEVWRLKKGPYLWPERVQEARQTISALVPAGERLILVDEDGWGYENESGEVVVGRQVVPFPERDGIYAGRPPDGATAVLELEQLRADGANLIAFTWDTMWWLDEYRELNDYLRTTFPCVLANDLLLVFDLR